LKKHYVLIGIGVAALVATTVVVIGSSTGGDGVTAASGTPTAIGSLPSGHPSVSGNAASATGNPSVKQTITALKAAVKAHPQDLGLLLKLGDAFFLDQNYGQAGRAFRSALRLAPGDAAATVRMAMVWHADGDSPRAIATLKDVLAATPRDQEAHYYLAIVYFSQKDTERAEAEWTIAAQLDSTSAIGRRSRSFVDLLEGRQSSSPGTGGGD
jgi:cytochrome c-type biogenesis protein CcmH/NrfG